MSFLWLRYARLVTALALIASGVAMAKPAESLRIWGSESAHDLRKRYHIALLRLALEATQTSDTRYEVESVDFQASKFPPDRALRLLDDGVIDVMGAMTSTSREERWLPVRIPLTRGLIGYRLFLIHEDQRAKLAGIKSMRQLRRLSFGVQSDWPDREILERHGFQVVVSPTYEGLFDMLRAGRFDLLSRGLHEIWDEFRVRGEGKLVVEPHLLLHFPAADYFFVAKSRTKLAERIERGLLLALKDGTFQATLSSFYGHTLTMADLSKRRLVEIPNPLLPKSTPIGVDAFWLNLKELGARLPEDGGDQSPKLAAPEGSTRPGAKRRIRVRGPAGPFDFRLHYHLALLNLAFEKTIVDFGEYELASVDYRSGKGYRQSKALDLLAQGNEIDVVASMATKERCQRFYCVKVPLDHSYLGLRVLVIRAADEARFAKIKSSAKIRQLRICVGDDWPDREVLTRAGIPVVTRSTIDELYEAVANGKCDALTRAAFEAWDEVVSRPALKLRIEPDLALTFPAAQVFMVRTADKELALRIEAGLLRAQKDDSFDRLFKSVHMPSLERVHLAHRQAMVLPNPLMPKAIPVDKLPPLTKLN